MKTKIYYGRDLIGRFTCDGKNYTKWQLFVYRTGKRIRKAMDYMAIISLVGWSSLATFTLTYSAPVVQADYEVPVKEEKIAPVLERIAKCESGGQHFKDGQVVFNGGNTNKTVDIGKYQINSVWSKKATEMKLDLTNEKDNETFAKYLYETHGTEPWYSSKACWNK